MKKITLFFTTIFSVIVLWGQKIPFDYQEHLPEKVKKHYSEMHKKTLHLNLLRASFETAYAIDSIIFYSDTSGTFQAEKYIKIVDYFENDSFPALLYSFNRDFDTLERLAVSFKYMKDLYPHEFYYQNPIYYMYLNDSINYSIYDNGWVFKTMYNYIYNDVYQDYFIEKYIDYNYDFTNHQYTGGYKYEIYFTDENFLDKEVYYNYDATNEMWNYSYRNLYTTDNQGVILTQTSQNYDLPSSTWINSVKESYHYNSIGNIDTLVTQTWDNSANDWVNDTKTIKTYQDDSVLLEILYQSWATAPNNVWIDDYKYVYEYNEDGTVSSYEKLNYDFVQGTWTPEYKYIYNYYDDGQLMERIYQSWDNTQGQLQNHFRYYFEYTNGNMTLYLYQTWDNTATNWLNNFRYIYEYNQNNSLTSALRQTWNNTNNTWENFFKNTYDYQDIVKTARHYYNWTSKSWQESQREEYYWHSFVANENNVNINTQKYIYPNPATDYIYLPIEDGFVKIYSLDGKLVKNVEIKGSRLDISDINPGVYTIFINNTKTSFTDKLIKF